MGGLKYQNTTLQYHRFDLAQANPLPIIITEQLVFLLKMEILSKE